MPEVADRERAPLPACPDCGASLQDERQEVCIECGSAAPAGTRRAARRAVPPVAVALFGTLMAASAAYGLSADLGGSTHVPAPKQQIAAVAPPATATPPTASTTPTTTTPPAATTTAPTSPAPTPTPASKPASQAAPKAASPAPSTSGAPASSSPSPGPTTTTSTPPARHSGERTTSKPARHHGHGHHAAGPAWLAQGDQPYSASLYDPYANGSDEHASAASKAVDGKAKTAWTTANHPGGLGKPGVGLVVETGGYQGYSALGIQTATPGFRVEIYSTDASDPPAGGPSNGWKLEATKAGVSKQQRIALKGATAQPTYLLVWITALPAGKPRAGLSEITLLP